MGRLDTERGPVLRVYEFDRYNGTVWQVDMLLANGSFVAHPRYALSLLDCTRQSMQHCNLPLCLSILLFYSHSRILNPTEHDLRGYWWTCVAVDAEPSTRIFTPATHVAETSRDPMRTAPWPHFAEAIENASFAGYQDQWPTDNSYLGNHQIGDMFLRLPADQIYQPYIGHNQEGDKGYTLIHGHPLNGTKFYTWGQSGPGRFMQDFLAGGGKRQGDYTELQVGPAPTQMQNFAVPKLSSQQWTEWFKGELYYFHPGSCILEHVLTAPPLLSVYVIQGSSATRPSCAARTTTQRWARSTPGCAPMPACPTTPSRTWTSSSLTSRTCP